MTNNKKQSALEFCQKERLRRYLRQKAKDIEELRRLNNPNYKHLPGSFYTMASNLTDRPTPQT